MRLLGIDPGKATGWAAIEIGEDHKITPADWGVTRDMTLIELKDQIERADLVVYEGYWIRPDMAEKGDFNWQNVPAEKVIGSLTTLCKLMETELIAKPQQPSQRVVGYAFAGMVYKKGAKGKHKEDALAHVVYYAVKKLRALPIHVS